MTFQSETILSTAEWVKNEIFCHSHINECQSYKHSILTVLAQIRADFKVKKQKMAGKKR
jgi:hypothetical protein